jgi:copper chaperone CopZ
MGMKSLVVAMIVGLGMGGALRADEAKELLTTITIEGMHCVSCSKKLTKAFKAVPDVGAVSVDAETGLATISPKADVVPSPKALWEAVEKAGYKPVKLEGPGGTVDEKPKS